MQVKTSYLEIISKCKLIDYIQTAAGCMKEIWTDGMNEYTCTWFLSNEKEIPNTISTIKCL